MVSSGRVNSDLSSIKSNLSNYDNFIAEMSGSWKGMSYDNLSSKASAFSQEFSSSITSQMDSFATACDLYERYIETKSSLASARSSYNAAVQSNDNSSASSYSSRISSLESDLRNLKGQIENALAAVTGVKVEAATPVTTTTATPTASGANGVALDAKGNLANPYIEHGSNAHTEGLAPAMKVRIDKLATRYYQMTGKKLRINSGSRTMAEQQRMYDKYGSGRAAKPTKNAPHIAGMAVDIDSSQADWLDKNGVLKECGLYRPLLNWGSSGGTDEPWHIELTEWRPNGRNTDYVMTLTA